MEPPKKQYAVWQADFENQDEETYYNHYDTIAEAVEDNDKDDTEVFEVTYKSIGNYKILPKLSKIKKKNK